MEVDTNGADAKENNEVAANTDSRRQSLGPESAAKRLKLEPKASTPAAPKPALSRSFSHLSASSC